jgi:hypothetical protein
MLSVNYAECRKQALYAECFYAECRFAECHFAECCGAIKDSVIETFVSWNSFSRYLVTLSSTR